MSEMNGRNGAEIRTEKNARESQAPKILTSERHWRGPAVVVSAVSCCTSPPHNTLRQLAWQFTAHSLPATTNKYFQALALHLDLTVFST